MEYQWITVPTLLTAITKKDILFQGTHTLDPYQGCEFGCLYCDSPLQQMVYIKSNAVECLQKELRSLHNPTLVLGSVHDPYQPVEIQTKLTRSLLEVIKDTSLSAHILTKSAHILRDIDLISQIPQIQVTISFSSFQDVLAGRLEKDVHSVEQRFQTIKQLHEKGIQVNLALLPFIPFLIEQELDHISSYIEKLPITKVISKPLELKGIQKQQFLQQVIEPYYPKYLQQFIEMYAKSPLPPKKYYSTIQQKIQNSINKR